MKATFLAILISVVVVLVGAYNKQDIVSARIETCRGCALNRYPEIKRFVMEDAPHYKRVEVKFISGAQPELVLLGENDKELERLPFIGLDREQCNGLLIEKGFSRKSNDDL